MRYRVVISLFSVVTIGAVVAALAADPAPRGPVAPVAAPAPAVGPAPILAAPRIAIANPSFIFSQMQETKATLAALEDEHKKLIADSDQKKEAVKRMAENRSNYNPENVKYREATEQIDGAMAEIQAWQVTTQKKLDREQKWITKSLYDKIEAAVGQVAQQNSIDLVITDGRQDIKNIEEIPYDGLRQLINARNVLYANKGMDISERVILLLDAQYAASKK